MITIKQGGVRPWRVWMVLVALLVAGCNSGGGGGGNGNGGTNQQPTGTLSVTLGTPAAYPAVIPPSTNATPITFLSMISGNAAPSVLLLDELDADGSVVNEGIASLYDNGELADTERGDRMYTGTLMIGNVIAAEKHYRVRTMLNDQTIVSGSLNFWVSGCPATSRPSDPDLAVLDNQSGSLIFANEVMIRTEPGVAPDLDYINAIAAAVNGRVVGCIPSLRQYLLEIEGDGTAAGVYAAIDILVAHEDIATAFPNGQTLQPPTLPTSNSLLCDGVIDTQCQWYLDRIRAPQAWTLAGGGDPQRGVALIDFGVDCTRGDLDCDSNLYNDDPIDHGTGVAGLIGSRQNDTGMVGVAWNTRLYPYSFLGRAGSQYKLNELITASLGHANVRVINISAGTRSDFDGQIKEALCTAIDSGRLVVAAAGNPAGSDAASCQLSNVYPARYNTLTELCSNGADLQSGLLVVGATDIDNQLASWQDDNDQPQCSNQLYVDLYAPGKEIVTLSTETGYTLKNGTSYAAALVSGAASVLWTVYPGDSPQRIQDRLINRASLLTDTETTSPLFTEDQRVAGQRFLDIYRAVGGQDAIVIPDTTPDDFTIAAQMDVPLQSWVSSEVITITGIDSPTPVSISGGYYRIDDGVFTNADGVITNNQQLQLQLLSADTLNTASETTVTVGGISQVFSVTTRDVALQAAGDFQFFTQTNVPRNSVITSNSQTITGIPDGTIITITGGEYAINGGAFTNVAGVINNNDNVQVRLISSNNYATLTQAALIVGSVSRNFVVTTEMADTSPDAFSFNAQTDAPVNTVFTSNTINVTGLNAPAVISISGGEYAIDGGAFTSVTGFINNGQSVQLRQTSAVAFGVTATSTVTIGSVTGTFSVTTLAADTIPDDFTFVAQTNVPVNTLTTSNTIVVSGINTATNISITNGEYAIDGGAFTSSTGTVSNGQSVQVRVTSSLALATAVNATLTVGGVSRIFSVATEGADTTPDAFSFSAQTNAALNSVVSSETIIVTGINTTTTISISGGEYSIDGGLFTTATGSISNAQVVQVRLTTSDTPGITTTATLSIGGINGDFNVTTLPADTTPDTFSFDAQTDAPLSTLITSNSVIISGINTAAPISISGGEYSINGATFTNAAGTINNGQAVQVRLTTSATPGITTTATLTIGGISADFNVTTLSVYTVSTNAGAGGSITPPSQTVVQGDTTNFTVTPDFGYEITAVTGCGGLLNGNSYTTAAINADCTVTASFNLISLAINISYAVKQLQFNWAPVSGATHYQLFESPDGVSGFTQVGGNITGTNVTHNIAVHRHNWPNARYLIEVCQNANCFSSNEVTTTDGVLQSIGYFKASNPDVDDLLQAIALSGDGNTLAVGSRFEASAATGINGNQADNSAALAGAVYVYANNNGVWSQQAYIKASNAEAGDQFGFTVALNHDGNTMVVSAQFEDSAATGINGNQADNSASYSGAAYVFTRSGTVWSQQAYIKASNTEIFDDFGRSLALSDDGNTLAIGADAEQSNATGVNGNQADNSTSLAGAVYLYTRSGSTWSQQAYIKASNTAYGDYFGSSVALSSNGNTLAVGAIGEDSGATGVNGNQADDSVIGAGAVYVFTRSGSAWSQQAYIKSSNPGFEDYFGRYNLALSNDGNTLVVGAHNEDSNATGINGNQSDNSLTSAGAVYVFTRNLTTWSQQAYIKASNTGDNDQFGWAFSLTGDGNTLAVGAYGESSNATGVNGNQTDNSALSSGAVYIFTRSGTTWSQDSYIKAPNSDADDSFGYSVSISEDGNNLAVDAFWEDSAATGVGGDQSDNTASNSGAIYLY